MRKSLGFKALAVAIIFAAAPAMAADVSWVSTSSGAWSGTINWTNSVAPATGDNIYISDVTGGSSYTVTGGVPNSVTFGNMTVGGSGSNSITLNYNGDQDLFSNVTINPNGTFKFTNASWNRLNVVPGGFIYNNGVMVGGNQNLKISKSASGTAPTFQNRGQMILVDPLYPSKTGGNGAGKLEFDGFIVDNVGATFEVGNGGSLTLAAGSNTNSSLFGGTLMIRTGGTVVGNQGGFFGLAANPVDIRIEQGAYFRTAGNGGNNYYNLYNSGYVDTLNGGQNDFLTTGIIENHGTMASTRSVTMYGNIANKSDGTWIIGGASNASGLAMATASTFTNDGLFNVINAGAAGVAQTIFNLGTYINNGTINITANTCDSVFAGVSALLVNAATGTFNMSTGTNKMIFSGSGNTTNSHFNHGVMNLSTGTLVMKYGSADGGINIKNDGIINAGQDARIGGGGGGGNGSLWNYAPTSQLNLQGANYGDNWGIGDSGNMNDYAYIRQSDAGAITSGYGKVNVDMWGIGSVGGGVGGTTTPALWGHLVGTLKATGGTLTVDNWTAAPAYLIGTKGTSGTNYTHANTLVVESNGTIAADNGVMNIQNMAADVQVKGKLTAYNNGQILVNGSGMTIGNTGYIAATGATGGKLIMAAGNLTISSTVGSTFDATKTEVVFGGLTNQTFGVASADLGTAKANFTNNYAFGKMSLTGDNSAQVQLSAAGGSALYLYGLDLTSGMDLNVGDLNVYVNGTINLPGGTAVTGNHTFGNGDLGGNLLAGLGHLYQIGNLLSGDANGDGKVDVLDLGILATNWQKTGVGWAEADFNGDGKVDVLDLGILATNWQATSGSFMDAAAQAGLIVPEPATLALLGLGAAALIRRKR